MPELARAALQPGAPVCGGLGGNPRAEPSAPAHRNSGWSGAETPAKSQPQTIRPRYTS
jgi:hypothetical protein